MADFGNILGAVTHVTTALSKPKSLKSYLDNINQFGVQVKNNFEVNFSGLEKITFFITSITTPGIHQNFATLNYDGQLVELPINHDFDHDFTMTVLNDAQGFIYSAITNFIASESTNVLVNNGYTMTVKMMDGQRQYKGSMVTLRGVRIVSVGSLSLGYSDNDVSTFDVSFKAMTFSVTPGALETASNILGAINSII